VGSVTDTFTGTAGTALASHTADSGHTWTVGFSASTGIVITDTNRVRGPATVLTSYYTSWVPAAADYDVEADAFLYTAGGEGRDVGPTGRQSTSADTYYRFVISFDVVYLQKRVAGTNTTLASFDVGTPTANSTYNLRLQMVGTTIKGFVDDVERCSATDSAITAAGRAGISTFDGAANGTGNQLDNFFATDPPAVMAFVRRNARNALLRR
jgi:pectate lyase